MKVVYLGGPIKGETQDEAKGWRDYVASSLTDTAVCVSPLRCEPLVGETYDIVYDDPCFGTSKAIGAKNWFDVKNADVCLIYLPAPAEGRHQSYGTLLELGWAKGLGKTTIVVSDDLNIVEHPCVDKSADWVLNNFDDAIDVLNGVLEIYS